MTILEIIKFEEDWLTEVNLTKENIKIAFAGIRATALEQQPSDDCVSRADVLALAEKGTLVSNGNYKSVCKAIKALPSVIPKAEWKDIYAESEGSNSWIEFTCPHCGRRFGMESGQYGWSYGEAIPWKACPMCGGLAEHEPYKAESEEEK